MNNLRISYYHGRLGKGIRLKTRTEKAKILIFLKYGA
jgi:hypothetical protein